MQRRVDHRGSNKGKRALRAVTLDSDASLLSLFCCFVVFFCRFGHGLRGATSVYAGALDGQQLLAIDGSEKWHSTPKKSTKNGVKRRKNLRQPPNRHQHRHMTACRNDVQISRANCAETSESTFMKKKKPEILRKVSVLTHGGSDCQIHLEDIIPGFPCANCAGDLGVHFFTEMKEIRPRASVD